MRVNLRRHVYELIKIGRDRRLKFPEGPLRDAVDKLTEVARARLYFRTLETQTYQHPLPYIPSRDFI